MAKRKIIKKIVKSESNFSNKTKLFIIFILAFIFGFFGIRIAYNQPKLINIEQLVKSIKPKVVYKENMNNLYLDPILLKKYIDEDKKDYLLVDIRSDAEYKFGHIKGAISAPIYEDYKKVYDSLVNKDSWYQKINKDLIGKKQAIIYGYSPNADITLETADYLKKIIPTKILAVGWYEWKNNFYQWTPGVEMGGVNMDRYIEPAGPSALPKTANPPL